MAKDNEQGKQPKSQPSQGKRTNLNESIKGTGSGYAGGFERPRKGSAGDGTGSTGPRKTK